MVTLVGRLGIDDFLSGSGDNLLFGGRNSGVNLLEGMNGEIFRLVLGRGGNNHAFGRAHSDSGMIGDARFPFGHGGNASLFASDVGRNLLCGDANQRLGTNAGGNAKDVIELRNFGFPGNPWAFDDLSIARTAEGCGIILGGGFITVLGVSDLTGEMSASIPIHLGTTCCSTEPRDHVA